MRIAFPFCIGVIFLIIFYIRYSSIDSDYYYLRDDGLITLSHAKNLIDYGFIGVGPSGERVEGYSAPVQFFIYAIVYFFLRLNFSVFDTAQTLVCTFTVGVTFSLFFCERRYYSIISAMFTAFMLTQSTSFIEWHSSGMENAITHCLFLITAYLFFTFARSKVIDYRLSIVPFLASISRLDGMYNVLPILVIFSVYWRIVNKTNKGVIFSLATLSWWAAYNAWRYFYFGDLTPNTAYAQDIFVVDRAYALMTFDFSFLSNSLDLSKQIFLAHGGQFLLPALPALLVTKWRNGYGLLFAISVSIIITATCNPFFFGETRLDPTRTTTQMAIFVFVAISCILSCVQINRLSVIVPILMLIGYAEYSATYTTPHFLCCRLARFDGVRQTFLRAAAAEALPRPTVSNPDLGLMSWYKDFNIVDLGRLGSQFMAKLKNGPALGNYFFDYAAPDLINSHHFWSCRYFESIFADPRFRERYTPIAEEIVRYESCGDEPLPVGTWIRNDIRKSANTPERSLIDDLAKDLSVNRIQDELRACASRNGHVGDCAYVSRTAFRFLPEFRSSGRLLDLISAFVESKTKEFDLFLLTGFEDGQAANKVIASFEEAALAEPGNIQIGTGNGFDVYLNRRYLAYVNRKCSVPDILPPFYLHVVPRKSTSPEANVVSFLNLDFSFRTFGFKDNQKCVAFRYLPNVDISSIITGQWSPQYDVQIWNVHSDITTNR